MEILPICLRSNKGPSNIAIAAIFVGTLTGCVVGPDYKTPALAVPTHWGSKATSKPPQTPQLSQWWKQLRDPTLDALVEEAVAGNLDVATAKAKIREARATYREQRGALFPTVEGTASATRNRTAASDGTPASVYNEYEPGFDASWELDLFGGNKRAAEAAKYGVDAAEEDLRDTLVTLVGDVASYYVQAREYQALRDLAHRTGVSQRRTAELTQAEFGAGTATAIDAAKAAGEAASTEADIPTYETSYAQAVHKLAVLLGKPPAALDERLKTGGAIPRPKLDVSAGIPADILLSRPDVRGAERQLAQYTAKIGQAEADRYPSVSLTGSISSSATSISDLGKKSTIGWSFGPSLTVPIFQGGQLKAAVDVAKAQRDQYYIAYQSAVLTAMQDVEDGIVSLTQERLKNAKLITSAASYRKAADLSHELNKAGAVDYLNVLDADRSLYSAESSLIQSTANIASNYISLNKALGGGWDGQVDVSTPVVVDADTGPHLAKVQ
ncbi:efflux transporter outer membrane subunit (plasmid) [Rhizobium sp. AB2/73]|uniref:efflux transporter outer membrane subunit n=1 Tax=Rhizobium TaxID=379 RepID=UPI00084BDF1A|nr:RND transporter [Rhizobium sp. YK2]QYA14923.1 efflux transporter outer membrane subunit [Rhizobium sp. AB2/73]UEQ83088.1 efflux transporter outer membrane subunit [Rhizobium sp. AB2/73]